MIETMVHGRKILVAISRVQQWKFHDLLKKIMISYKINKLAITIPYQLRGLKHNAATNP
jgi:hypothetical protein